MAPGHHARAREQGQTPRECGPEEDESRQRQRAEGAHEGPGEPDTVGYRQALYLGFIALAVLGLWLATALWQRLRAGRRAAGAWVVPVVFYAVWAVALYALMPANPDPVHLSGTLVRPFRALSLAGLVLFWAAFAGSLALLARAGVVPRRHLAR